MTSQQNAPKDSGTAAPSANVRLLIKEFLERSGGVPPPEAAVDIDKRHLRLNDRCDDNPF